MRNGVEWQLPSACEWLVFRPVTTPTWKKAEQGSSVQSLTGQLLSVEKTLWREAGTQFPEMQAETPALLFYGIGGDRARVKGVALGCRRATGHIGSLLT